MKLVDRLIKCNSGNSTVMLVVGIAVAILVLAVIFTIAPVIGYNTETASTIPAAAEASGTLTLTGNTSCSEWINITSAGGILVPMRFNISTGCAQVPHGALNITVTLGGNGSTFSATNISGTINANATLSAVLSATNSSAGVVSLRYLTKGTGGNAVTTTETLANGSFSGATLTGGLDGSQWNPSDNTAMTNGTELWQQNSPMLAVAALIAIVGVIIAVLLLVAGGRRP